MRSLRLKWLDNSFFWRLSGIRLSILNFKHVSLERAEEITRTSQREAGEQRSEYTETVLLFESAWESSFFLQLGNRQRPAVDDADDACANDESFHGIPFYSASTFVGTNHAHSAPKIPVEMDTSQK